VVKYNQAGQKDGMMNKKFLMLMDDENSVKIKVYIV